MPILNYTTMIDAHRTLGEIMRLLAKAGAVNISIAFDGQGQPEALTFTISVYDNLIPFRLPTNWQGVHQRLLDQKVERRYQTEAHARNVAWRITKDWVEAHRAIIEAGMAQPQEVFLPYAVLPNNLTLYQTMVDHNYKLLTLPNP